MTISTVGLPVSETLEPSTVDELAGIIRAAGVQREAIYPVGGGASLGFGLPAQQPGRAVSLLGLSQVVDYPAGDMTITVQAGMTLTQLNEQLQHQGQQLPLDVADANRATIGGVLATNTNGPRRLGFGTARDYVIGIRAIDGRGLSFAGGGRVVKNVAGYDFCKLLVGSLGTLGIITEVTFKVKPQPPRREFIMGQPKDLPHTEQILAAMIQSKTHPSAFELVGGLRWQDADSLGGNADHDWLIAVLDGTNEEVDWMSQQLRDEWRELGVANLQVLNADDGQHLFQRLVEFPSDPEAGLMLKANVVPSGTTAVIQAARELDPTCSLHAHAGSGIIHLRFAEFPKEGLSRALSGFLRPIAIAHHGNIIVLSNPSGQEMTRQSVWGGIDQPFWMMDRIKAQFDPFNILNPGRFVYS